MEKEKYNKSYQFGRIITTPVFNHIYKPQVYNNEVIPDEGPVVFCGNHLHVWDQVPVICSTKRTIHWMAKKEYFESKLKYMYQFMGCIPVDREGNSSLSKDKAIEYLNLGSAIGIFPEGTRNQYQVAKLKLLRKKLELKKIIEDKPYDFFIKKETEEEIKILEENLNNIYEMYQSKGININEDEELLPFHFGAVSMAQKTDATIVPFGITGDYKKNSDNLILTYGSPFKVDGMNLETANDLLRSQILELVRNNYQKKLKK